MSTRSGLIMEDGAKYWVWMKSKPAVITNAVSSNKVVVLEGEENNWEERAFAVDSAPGPLGGFIWPPRSYTCSFCGREFRSAQALGGHMNVHRRDRARLKESDPPPIDHYSPNDNSIHRAVVHNSDHSIVSLLPLSSTQEIRDVNDAVEKTISLDSPSFAWPPTDVHEDNCAQMKDAAGSTLLSLDLPQTADPALVKVLNSTGSSSSSGSTAVCQSALKLDRDKSSSKAHETEVPDDELAKEDSTAGTGSAVSLSSNIDSNRPTHSSNIPPHVSRIANKRRRRDLPPSLSLSLLIPKAGTAGSTPSVLDKVNGLLHSYKSSMDELDLELRL